MSLHHQIAPEPVVFNPLLMEGSLPPDLKAAAALVEAGLATRVILVGLPVPTELCQPPYRLVVGEVQIETRSAPFPEEPCDLVVSKYEPMAVATTSETPVKLYERRAPQ